MNLSALWSLNRNDFIHGALSAIAAGVIVSLAGVASQPHFDLFTVDWAAAGHAAVNAGFAAFVGYLSLKLSTSANGKVFGRL